MNPTEKPILLVVDDNDDYRPLLALILGIQGYEVEQASNPSDGLAVLRSARRVDLLISDVRMPVMSGEDMVLQAREVRPDLRVIFLTGCVSDMHVNWEAGEATYIFNKPVRLECLLNAISTMLSLPARTHLPPTTGGNARPPP